MSAILLMAVMAMLAIVPASICSAEGYVPQLIAKDAVVGKIAETGNVCLGITNRFGLTQAATYGKKLNVFGRPQSASIDENKHYTVGWVSQNDEYYAVAWRGRNPIRLSDAEFSFAQAISSTGQIYGLVYRSGNDSRPAIWTIRGNKVTEKVIDVVGYPTDISGNGVAIGAGFIDEKWQAFRYTTSAGLEPLGSTGETSEATAINRDGLIVGNCFDSNGSRGSVFYPQGGIKSLPGGDQSWTKDINSSGLIVGQIRVNDGELIAVIWYLDREGEYQITDLESLLPAGWQLEDAQSIDDAGRISASGYNAKGEWGYWLLTPQ